MALDYLEPVQPLHRTEDPEVGVVRPVGLPLPEEVPPYPLGHLVQLVLEVLDGGEVEHLRPALAHHPHDECPEPLVDHAAATREVVDPGHVVEGLEGGPVRGVDHCDDGLAQHLVREVHPPVLLGVLALPGE